MRLWCLLLLLLLPVTAMATGNKEKSKYDFRGHVFGSAPTEAMREEGEPEVIGLGGPPKKLQTFVIQNDDMKVGDLTASSITYDYFDGKLYGVTIIIDAVSDVTDRIFAVKFGNQFSSAKYKEEPNFLSRASGQRRFVKKIMIKSKSLEIKIEKSSGSQIVMPSTKIIYLDSDYKKEILRLMANDEKLKLREEKNKTERLIRDSADSL